eukprot:5395700-Lingulodinium_polyedra.AAC.1
MDDQVLIEPDIGVRPFESSRIAKEGTAKLLGPAAVNAEMGDPQDQLGHPLRHRARHQGPPQGKA